VVTFERVSRKELNTALRAIRPVQAVGEEKPVEVHGILRGLHLDQDWLEVTVDDPPAGTSNHLRITGAGAALDDVVGPMVNKRVIVTAAKNGTKFSYRDIVLEE
jgi:hypothetical protein